MKTNIKAISIALAIFIIAFVSGEIITRQKARPEAVTEYEKLMGISEKKVGLPPPSEIFVYAYDALQKPFYDAGPNDKGIGLQVLYSLGRVMTGYLLAILLAVPAGFLIGMSPVMQKALNPYIQLLKPISPLAWMPLALFVIKDSALSAIFVIFICSIWPILINTAFGVASVKRDYLNVAKTLEMSPLQTAFKIILPAAAPTIFAGLRISIGISWLVIVAAEMLVGGTGIGYFVWNEWNNLDLASVIFSILVIGLVGMLLDFAIARTGKVFSYVD